MRERCRLRVPSFRLRRRVVGRRGRRLRGSGGELRSRTGEFAEGGHAALAVLNDVDDLFGFEALANAYERWESWLDAADVVAVADGAVPGVGGGADLVLGGQAASVEVDGGGGLGFFARTNDVFAGAEVFEERVEAGVLHVGEGWHAALAIVDEGFDLGVGDALADADERGEFGWGALALGAVADRALAHVSGMRRCRVRAWFLSGRRCRVRRWR